MSFSRRRLVASLPLLCYPVARLPLRHILVVSRPLLRIERRALI